MVCKFNSNVTSYNDRNASFKIALSVRLEALVFVTRAIMCRRSCFMTLALPRVASRIMGGFLFLATNVNRCHMIPRYNLSYKYYDIVFTGKKTVTDNVALKSYAWSILSKMGSSESLFVVALTLAIAFSVVPEKLFWRRIMVLRIVVRGHRNWELAFIAGIVICYSCSIVTLFLSLGYYSRFRLSDCAYAYRKR